MFGGLKNKLVARKNLVIILFLYLTTLIPKFILLAISSPIDSIPMHSTIKLISLSFLLVATTSGFTQTLEQLEDKIAKTWQDSLAKHIPFFYLTDEYIKVENEWDRKIFSLENKDVVQYLTLKGGLKPDVGLFSGKVFVSIARKALKGSEFHLSLYGKSSNNNDIKPTLVEFGKVVCDCQEKKARTIDPIKLTYKQQDSLKNQYLTECFQVNLAEHRSKLFLDYKFQDQYSSKQFSSITTGYFMTNCPTMVNASADLKASLWGDGIYRQLRRNYSRSAWNVIDALKEQITDTLSNQFISVQNFKGAKATLIKAQTALKSNPTAYSMTRPEDEAKKENRTTQAFNFIANKKALFQLVVEYETDPHSKLKSVVFIPREKIKNVQELDKILESSPPPPPTEELPKND